MEIDNNNNQDSDPDDPTLELEPLSEAACKKTMQAENAPAEPDAAAETEESHEICFETSAPVSDDTASEIQGLRDELKYVVDMNSILRHESDQLRERCDRLAEQVSSLLTTSETFSNELERSHQAEQRSSSGARRASPTRSLQTGRAPGSEVQDCLVLLGASGVDSDTWVLNDGINTIGSGLDCDIRIQSKFVSRHHAQLIKTLNGSILEDLDSTNGTYINARRINKRALKAGDLVTIGKHRLRYRERSDHLIMSDLSKFGSGVQSGGT